MDPGPHSRTCAARLWRQGACVFLQTHCWNFHLKPYMYTKLRWKIIWLCYNFSKLNSISGQPNIRSPRQKPLNQRALCRYYRRQAKACPLFYGLPRRQSHSSWSSRCKLWFLNEERISKNNKVCKVQKVQIKISSPQWSERKDQDQVHRHIWTWSFLPVHNDLMWT